MGHIDIRSKPKREAAVQSIREAIEGYVLALKDDGLPVPAEPFDAVLLAV